ncbi:glycoside hydrolase domain-containing protein [Microlunatus speluncae]|uniref:glycoside hydrolase domain-containing protein n=1 Tax=Microlunatus speluncae TaxID=2594267 RepID=UPI001375BA77|nr:glycoside hydrolase domain-containing protein [Microlunatus speluncae]
MRRWSGLVLIMGIVAGLAVMSPPRAAAADEVLTSVWTATSYDNVFAADVAPRDATTAIELLAARNEFESGQVLIRKTADFTIEGVEFSDLAGPGTLSADNLDYRFVEFEQLPANSAFGGGRQPVTNPIRKAPDAFPDALSNDPTIEVPANTTQPIWIRGFVPKDTKPGEYRGTVLVITSQGTSKIDLTLTVAAATIPDAGRSSFTTDLWMLQYGSLSWDEGDGDTIEIFYGHKRLSPVWWQLMGEFAKSMKENRHNNLPVNLVQLLIGGGSKPDAGGKFTFDWSVFDQFVQFFDDRGVVKQLEGFWMAGPNVHGDPYPQLEVINSEGRRDYAHWDSTEATSFVDQLVPALRDHLKEKGWQDKWWMHVGDEPSGPETLKMQVGLAAKYRSHWPEVRLADAVVDFGSVETVGKHQTFLIPNELILNEHEKYYADQVAAGKDVWLYNCNVPTWSYLNRFIDQPVWHQRATMWYAYSRDLSGYLHWAFNNWQYKMQDQEVRGDGWITKPDKKNNKLKGTIRLESLRDGLEDRELLELVGKQNPTLAKDLAGSLVSTANRYSRDTAYMQRIRALLVRAAAGEDPVRPDEQTGRDGVGVIDLGAQYQVDGVRLRNAKSGATIETSFDGKRWSKAVSTKRPVEFAGLNAKARYVRVTASRLTGFTVAGAELARPNLAGGRTYQKPDGVSGDYADTADSEATDGLLAGHFDDQRSFAYDLPADSTEDYAVVVDLGDQRSVDQVKIHRYEEYDAAKYAPDGITVAISADGKTYRQKGVSTSPSRYGVWYDVRSPVDQARYVKITYRKAAAANADMIFLDEIEVYGPADGLTNLAAGARYQKSAEPDDPFYRDDRGRESTDGVIAGDGRDGVGYAYYLGGEESRRTVSVTVDLDGPKLISEVQLQRYFDGFHQYQPDRVKIAIKPTGGDFKQVGDLAWPTGTWYRAAFDPVEATAVRIDVTKADGRFADYLFLDELAVIGDPAESPSNLVAGADYTRSAEFQDPSYGDAGHESTDGVLAGHYSDGESYAYYFTDSGPERTIMIDFDLGQARTISMGRFRQYFDGEHDYAPDKVTLLTSDDGQTWTERASTDTAAERWFDLGFAPVDARYVRFAATKKPGYFAEYIFVDELQIFGR